MSSMHGPRLRYPLGEVLESLLGVNADNWLHCPLAEIEDTDERLYRLRLFCEPLLRGVHHPARHFDELDQQLSRLLPRPASPLAGSDPTDIHGVHSKVEHLLSRLPKVPQRSFSLPLNNGLMREQGTTLWDGIRDGRWATRYIMPEAQSHFHTQSPGGADSILDLLRKLQDLAWDNLYVTTYVDTNSLKLAAAFANHGTQPNHNLAQRSLKYVNLLSELFDGYHSMSDAVSFGIKAPFEDSSSQGRALKDALFPQNRDDHEQAMAIIKVFLWSAWQRSVMLHFYYVIGVQLTHGYSSTWNSLLAVRGVHELEWLSRDDYRGNCTEYLCNWAFELLRTSRTSVGLDFRRMIARFDAHFHGRPGRCIQGSNHTCEGGQPETCQRFTAAETAAQSAHSSICDRQCEKISWDASSYHQSPKPAAIVAAEDATCLVYAVVNSKTLAISHVWSHGQGGRPESGINACLHQRYCRLAHLFECDTYWIDAACIPSELTLRRQAIDNINHIFATAKVTLVIDADVQAIDVAWPDPTVAEIETLVSTLLVSDWTVRGWTLLEGIRGSRAIYLLCEQDRVLSLREALVTLHEQGAIDIAVLLGSAQHLIPHSDLTSTKTVEEAGYLLSQRHTSWPEDVIICWSLLINAPVHRKAVDLWKNQSRVRTGYLLSSAPRVAEMQGWAWAPASPYIRPNHRTVDLPEGRTQEYTVRFPCYDGDGSLSAAITPNGLLGRWRVVNIEPAFLEDARELCCHMTAPLEAYQEDEMDLENAELVYAHPDEALAWHTLEALLNQGAELRLVRALAEDGVSPYVGSSQRGENFGLIAAICASFNNRSSWEWKGVFSWQESENYQGWEVDEMLIV
ncbi:uncharacterized protein Z518_06031 [Rhinocladiella mackenziei CBS 650.93]|uniref:Heterokaryon incompatibility domain-containing protein n=1 Tax=Rhinocladiella mackenziei CBS 650.93 TaxID=1442369 RepID=A0A0D2IHA5_9EURO|nr:uncharacterized protein Z518_06031 [Rhinocladiella mackenziei CBS 650.93]KIX05159.1 hypothetical protein Z518_06031 [Rhinocladiella mackenziei CBS 650.93]